MGHSEKRCANGAGHGSRLNPASCVGKLKLQGFDLLILHMSHTLLVIAETVKVMLTSEWGSELNKLDCCHTVVARVQRETINSLTKGHCLLVWNSSCDQSFEIRVVLTKRTYRSLYVCTIYFLSKSSYESYVWLLLLLLPLQCLCFRFSYQAMSHYSM